MPISTPAQVLYVITPATFNADGSINLTLVGRAHAQTGEVYEVLRKDIVVPPQDSAAIMGAAPVAGRARLDDLTIALYEYLVDKGLAPSGQVY